MAAKKTKWDEALVAKMVTNPGDRSKIPTQYLPDKYKQMRERNQWTPAKVAAAIGNPGTRANVPTGLLPEKYRKIREQNERFAAPITPGSSLTYGDVARQRKAAETLQFGADPVGRALAREKQTSDYYEAYKNDLAAARVRQEGYGQQAVSQFAGMAGTAGQVPAGLSGENAKVASNAQGVRDQLRAGVGQELASRAASANTLASSQQANAGLLKAEAMKKAGDDTQALRDKLGAWRQQYMDTARDSEAKNVLALSIAKDKTTAELASEAAKLAQQDRESRRQANTSRMNNALNNATSLANNAANNANKNKPKGKSPWLSQGQQNTFRNSVENARAAIPALKKAGASRAEVADMLRRGGNGLPKIGNSLALSVALDSIYDGALSRRTVQRLHNDGYKIGPLGLKITPKNVSQKDLNSAASNVLRSPLG